MNYIKRFLKSDLTREVAVQNNDRNWPVLLYIILFQLKLGFIIDLTYTTRFYDKAAVENNHECRYLKLQMRG